ncbi:hypothetical protein GCK72_025856 [Caenorhabditis remanei]|uniref:Uncharacterized protein n=1 Tax=Caenorhabditis remanei TaxID=31234 RepID=A0A6A5G329_CAERE|nr:hypothetical protein GCK72_025856 [Caenorhabditis remanei]KAF1749388.1 hypothetical protein GCK72_025856 [Caenorhabditis remanei]
MRFTVLIVLFTLLVAAHAKCVCRSNEDEWNSYRVKVGESLRFVSGQPLPGTKRCHDDADFFHLINGTWFAIPQKKDIRKWWAELRLYKDNVVYTIYIDVVDRDWKPENGTFKTPETTTVKIPKPWTRPTTVRPDSPTTRVPAVTGSTEKVCRPRVTPTWRTTKLLPTPTRMMPTTTTTQSPVSSTRTGLVTPLLSTTRTLAPTSTPAFTTTTTPTLSTTTTEVMTPTTTITMPSSTQSTSTTTPSTTTPLPVSTATRTSTLGLPTTTLSGSSTTTFGWYLDFEVSTNAGMSTPPTTTPTSSTPTPTSKSDSSTTAGFVLETTLTSSTSTPITTRETTTTPGTTMSTSPDPLPSTTPVPVVPEDMFPPGWFFGLIVFGVAVGVVFFLADCIARCRGG